MNGRAVGCWYELLPVGLASAPHRGWRVEWNVSSNRGEGRLPYSAFSMSNSTDRDEFERGQRLVSDSEPALGLGLVLKKEFGRVEVFFPAANEHRQYALRSAPLRRVRFKEGDAITLHTGEKRRVVSVSEVQALLVYCTAEGEVEEAQLADSISFSTPEARLLAGQTDESHLFELRHETLRRRAKILGSPVRGFVGGRVDLIPHQMYIARQVVSGLSPRALLADEVGLGKTIEAGLILHRLHLAGRAQRILVLVPDPLVNQWFVELWRRFNLLFSVFDAERCESIEANNPETNPFLDSQLVIASISFACGDPARAAQLCGAGWDLLIVDEAHHLRWTSKEASAEYLLVESLARAISGVLLLTATPQQLGPDGHFARLRLLDPEKYSDLKSFNASAARYQEVAHFIDAVLSADVLDAAKVKQFSGRSKRVAAHLKEIEQGHEEARGLVVSELLDAFGIGRAMYRNTRAALQGFPKRIAVLKELNGGDTENEIVVKLRWLIELLHSLGDAKVLLICTSRVLAEQLVEKLLQIVQIKVALFHEGLTLLQRDRNAAYFSEVEGARLLVCSEIGSEGRNFQFAHHLVLFDLPGNPELLEQRIGRLDRIGQTEDVRIYVPYFKGTIGEVLARWYHEGLNAFESSVHGGGEIWISQHKDLEKLEKKFSAAGLRKLLAAAVELREEVGRRLEEGNDRLLELASCRADLAEATLAQVRECDEDREFEDFALRLLDCCGVAIENLEKAGRGYLFSPGPMMREALGSLPPEGFSATFSRRRAMQREDVRFVTMDHPIIGEAMDSLLGGEKGNVSFVIWPGSGAESILLEVVVVIECVAEGALHMDRFMPPTPVRVLVDPGCEEVSATVSFERAVFEEGDVFRLLDRGAVKKKLLPAMIEKVKMIAAEKMGLLVSVAQTQMDEQLRAEILRSEELRELHPDRRADEVEKLKERAQKMRDALAGARFRVDSMRLIWRMA